MVFRIGVIGAGSHGARYLRHALADVPGMTATTLYRRDQAAASDLATASSRVAGATERARRRRVARACGYQPHQVTDDGNSGVSLGSSLPVPERQSTAGWD